MDAEEYGRVSVHDSLLDVARFYLRKLGASLAGDKCKAWCMREYVGRQMRFPYEISCFLAVMRCPFEILCFLAADFSFHGVM